MKPFLIAIIIFLFAFQNKDISNHRIKGVLLNYYSEKPIVFAGIHAIINDTILSSGISDFDGLFVIVLPEKINDSAKIELEILYPSNFSKRIQLDNSTLTDLTFKLKTDTTLTGKEIKLWVNEFRSKYGPSECGTVKDEKYIELEFKE